jgi:hypothetical protein
LGISAGKGKARRRTLNETKGENKEEEEHTRLGSPFCS